MKIDDLRKVLPDMGEGLEASLVEGLLLSMQNIVYVYDLAESRYLFITGEVTSILGYTAEEIVAMGNEVMAKLVHPEDAPRLSGHQKQCAQARIGDMLEVEYRSRHAYGDWHWLSVRETPLIRAGEDTSRYLLGIAEDISERRAAQEKVWFVSTHDQLTGLYNRAYFEAEINRMEKGRHFPISVLCTDVENLRGVNEDQGHAGGDDLLRRAAQVLHESFRSEDVVARFSGDEFAVLLPNTGNISSDAILTRVRNQVANNNRLQKKAPLTLSLAMATAEQGQSLREAVKSAEKRLYDAKINRRRTTP
jgi:diguanylate cyclase (GGDEF)-like protein/PAS domain S-box-containing protein